MSEDPAAFEMSHSRNDAVVWCAVHFAGDGVDFQCLYDYNTYIPWIMPRPNPATLHSDCPLIFLASHPIDPDHVIPLSHFPPCIFYFILDSVNRTCFLAVLQN